MAAFKYKRRLWKMINAWVFSWWYSGACFDHCKHLKMELFAKTVNGLKPLTLFAKRSILDVCNGSEYMLFEKVRTSVFCFPFYIIHKGHWKKTSVEIEWNEFSNKLAVEWKLYQLWLYYIDWLSYQKCNKIGWSSLCSFVNPFVFMLMHDVCWIDRMLRDLIAISTLI